MAWDLIAHLQGHAKEFKLFANKEKIEELIKDGKIENFKFSFSDTQFENTQEAVKKLKELINLIYQEPWAWNKNGKNKFTKRAINTDGIVAYAVHIDGKNGEHTHPHIHFLLNKSLDWGNGYYRLKQVILKHSLALRLIPHFAEPIELDKDFDIKGLMKKTTHFSWFIRSTTNEKFLKYIKFKQKDAIENIRALQQYTLKTRRFSFYYKVMLNLQTRLKKQHLNLEIDGISIRDNIPILLDDIEQKAIELIKTKNFTQKAIKKLKNSKVLEEYYNYCRWRDLDKCYILKAIKKNTTLLPVLPRNKKFLENYNKLYTKWYLEKLEEVKEKHLDEYAWKQQKAIKKQLKNNEKVIKKEEQKHDKTDILISIKEILKKDLLQVAKTCKNEKELREKMQELGYRKFGFKKKSGKIIGYQFIPPRENKKIVVKCTDSIKIEEIRAFLKENYLKAKEGQEIKKEEIKSNIEEYKLPIKKQLPVVYIQPNGILKIKEKKENELQERIREIRERLERGISEEIKTGIRKVGTDTNTEIDGYNKKTETTNTRIRRAEQLLSNATKTITNTISAIGEKISNIKKGIRKIRDKILKQNNFQKRKKKSWDIGI